MFASLYARTIPNPVKVQLIGTLFVFSLLICASAGSAQAAALCDGAELPGASGKQSNAIDLGQKKARQSVPAESVKDSHPEAKAAGAVEHISQPSNSKDLAAR